MRDLANAPNATLQNVPESLPRRVEVIITAQGTKTGKGCVKKKHIGVMVRCISSQAKVTGHTATYWICHLDISQ